MATESLPQTKDPVRIRPRVVEWLCVSFFWLLGVGGLVGAGIVARRPFTPVDMAMSVGFALMCFFPAALFTLMMLKIEVIADEDGLRWREWLKWKQCRWDDVTDYYDQLSRRTRRRAVVVTIAGAIAVDPNGSTRSHYARSFNETPPMPQLRSGWFSARGLSTPGRANSITELRIIAR